MAPWTSQSSRVQWIFSSVCAVALVATSATSAHASNGPQVAQASPRGHHAERKGKGPRKPRRVRYDELPAQASYVVEAKWAPTKSGKYVIIFSPKNGTSDISGEGENSAIKQAMELWIAATKVVFFKYNISTQAWISWQVGSHGDCCPFDGTGGVLAHTFLPPDGDLHFDDAESWTLSTRPDATQPIDLVTVAAHEIGHMLGLGHSSDPNSLMYPYYSGSHRYLGEDDIQGIQSMYGAGPGEIFWP